MYLLLLPFLSAAHAEEYVPPLLILHVDPAASVEEGAWSGELGGRVEFPLLTDGVWIAIGALRLHKGDLDALDDMFAPLPPLSAMYTGYVARSFDDPARWSGAGGLAIRYRPLAYSPLPAEGRGLWIDVGGRYGTRGWGLDGGVGWDVQLTRGLAVGPAATMAWEGGAVRYLASLSVSFWLYADTLGPQTKLGSERDAARAEPDEGE